MYTEKQLVEFGNELLSTYNVQVHSTDGKNIPIYPRQVTDADVCNWKHKAGLTGEIIPHGESFTILSFQNNRSGTKDVGLKINSVKRTRDGEVFTIDDKVTNGTQMVGNITGFSLLEGQIYVDHTWSGIGMNLESLTKILEIPSKFKQGDKVKVFLMPEGEDNFPGFGAEVVNVHFYGKKVKYDLEIKFAGEHSTRIYNIDSVLVEGRN